MRKRTRLNIASRLQHITEAQSGYFTRAQAHQAGVADFELDRALSYDQTRRLDAGIYRLVGAPVDLHQQLRVASLRLTPTAEPRDRFLHPTVWVSHQSAAIIHGFGDYIADVPQFIATRRIRPRFEVDIKVERDGLARNEWVIRDEFAVTSPVRTFLDLAAAGGDGGHLGRYVDDAVRAGAASLKDMQDAAGAEIDVRALVAMAAK